MPHNNKLARRIDCDHAQALPVPQGPARGASRPARDDGKRTDAHSLPSLPGPDLAEPHGIEPPLGRSRWLRADDECSSPTPHARRR